MLKDQLLALDRAHLIHPVSNFRAHERRGATIFRSGRGATLTDIDGNKLLDAFSGLWCVNLGYGQKSIVRAAAEQMTRLPYGTGYFSFATEPAIQLAARLVELAPASLKRVYFTTGGSDAIDSALRFITQYFNAIGQPQRKHIIALERAYHGSSALGSGVTGLTAFHRHFDLPQANQHHIPTHYAYRNPVSQDPAAIITASVAALRTKVRDLGADRVAAFFCEPVQGSGGVIVPPSGWLKAMSETCFELGILLVVDEVITGFGRTGPLFACEAEGVRPDLMTIAKGLTSGYTPMGALLMSERIYAGIADQPARDAVIGHGHTYSAHPVSAAIALECLRLYFEGGVLANGIRMAPVFAEGLNSLQSHPLVGEARHRGLLGALELVADKEKKKPFDPALNLSARVAAIAYQNGLLFRAFSDNILGFAPALCFTETDFERLFVRLKRTLNAVLREPDVRAACRATRSHQAASTTIS